VERIKGSENKLDVEILIERAIADMEVIRISAEE
jgi:hypothetical protein